MDKRKPDDWMPLDVRKYLGDTMHLSREEHGAYLLLIMAYWMRGGPLADSDRELGAIVRASPTDWKHLKPVMEAFFDVKDGKWTHRKIEKELARARELIAKKSKSGKAGAEARWGTDAERNADANGERIADALPVPMADDVPTQWQTDAPLPLPVPKKEKTLPASAGLDGFEEFWKTYRPPPNAKKPDARKAWLATANERPPLPDLLRAVSAYLTWLSGESRKRGSEYPKQHPATWLRGEVWNGYLGANAPADAFQNTDERGWRDRMRVWRERQGWAPKWGPKPGEPGCKCPQNILDEGKSQ